MRGKVVLATIVAGFLSGVSEAGAQCLLDLTAEFEPALTAFDAEVEVRTTGTFDCGVVQGTVCSVGTVNGSCTVSSATGRTVGCEGTCEIVVENGDVKPVCHGTLASIGTFSSDCASGLCVVENQGDDGSTSFAVLATDPEELVGGVEACGPAGRGVEETTFTGVTTIPAPAP